MKCFQTQAHHMYLLFYYYRYILVFSLAWAYIEVGFDGSVQPSTQNEVVVTVLTCVYYIPYMHSSILVFTYDNVLIYTHLVMLM